MKAMRYLGTGLILLALGIAGPVYSHRQEDKRQQEDKNKQQPPTKQQEPPKQQQARPQQQASPKQQPQQQSPPKQQQQQQQQRTQPQQQSRPQEQPKQQQSRQQQPTSTTRTTKQPQQAYGGAYHGGVKATAPTNGGVHPSGVPQHSGQVRSGFAQSKAGSWDRDHRTWQQRGGYNGYRIQDARFSLYFGREHHFRISGLPILFVGGFPRFQYDGYWITFVDPWPDNWPPDWYETDDIYLDYTDDGYYLYDANYPGIGIAVTVSN
jgi:hypothetical protein